VARLLKRLVVLLPAFFGCNKACQAIYQFSCLPADYSQTIEAPNGANIASW